MKMNKSINRTFHSTPTSAHQINSLFYRKWSLSPITPIKLNPLKVMIPSRSSHFHYKLQRIQYKVGNQTSTPHCKLIPSNCQKKKQITKQTNMLTIVKSRRPRSNWTNYNNQIDLTARPSTRSVKPHRICLRQYKPILRKAPKPSFQTAFPHPNHPRKKKILLWIWMEIVTRTPTLSAVGRSGKNSKQERMREESSSESFFWFSVSGSLFLELWFGCGV